VDDQLADSLGPDTKEGNSAPVAYRAPLMSAESAVYMHVSSSYDSFLIRAASLKKDY
jgi:hypothetical protein